MYFRPPLASVANKADVGRLRPRHGAEGVTRIHGEERSGTCDRRAKLGELLKFRTQRPIGAVVFEIYDGGGCRFFDRDRRRANRGRWGRQCILRGQKTGP